LGNERDRRQRELEFAPVDNPDRAERIRAITDAVADADRVLGDLDATRLFDTHHIQGREVTGFDAIYHAVEHFAMHTGQILYIVKSRTGRDLAFYEMVEGIPRERWK
jgi:uncharacterized damage-inducible protein DinB